MAIESALLEDFGQIAEIAATMAGFAAVAGVIQRAGGDEAATRVKVWAAGSLLATTVACLVLALLPTWLQRVFATDVTVWRTCFGVFVIIQVLTFSIFFLTTDFRPLPTSIPGYVRAMLATMNLIFIVTGLSLTVVGAISLLGYLEAYWEVLYHGVLLFLLVNSGGTFVTMLYASSGRWEKDPSK